MKRSRAGLTSPPMSIYQPLLNVKYVFAAFETLRGPVSLRVRCQISPQHAPLATRGDAACRAAPQ